MGAGERIRTADLPFTRSTASCTERSTCTDDTDHRTDGTHHAGIIWRAGPRTGPRPRPLCPWILLLRVNVSGVLDSRPQADTAWGPTVDLYAATHTARLSDTRIMPMSGCPPKIGALLPLQPAQAPLKSCRRRRCRGMYEPRLVDDAPGAVDSKHRQTVAVPVTSVQIPEPDQSRVTLD